MLTKQPSGLVLACQVCLSTVGIAVCTHSDWHRNYGMWGQLINECLIYTVSLRLIGDFLTSLLSGVLPRLGF